MTLKLPSLILLLTLLQTNLAQSIGNGFVPTEIVSDNADAGIGLLNSNQMFNLNVAATNNVDNQALNSGLLAFQNIPEPINEQNNNNDLNRSARGSFLGGFGNQSPFPSSLINNPNPTNQIANNLAGFKGFSNGLATGTAMSGIPNTLTNGLANRGAVDGIPRSVRATGIDNLINQAGMIGSPFSGGTFTNSLPNPSFLANSPLSNNPANPHFPFNNPGFPGPSLDFPNQLPFNGIPNSFGGSLNNNLLNTANSLATAPIPNSLPNGNGFAGNNIPSLSTLDFANHKKTLATITGINPSNLGSVSKLAVSSTGPLSPTGLSILAENLLMDGSVSVTGKLPFVGTVNVEGTIPDNGVGTVFYECGNGNVGITEDRSLGSNNFGPRQLNNGVGNNLGFNNRGFTRSM